MDDDHQRNIDLLRSVGFKLDGKTWMKEFDPDDGRDFWDGPLGIGASTAEEATYRDLCEWLESSGIKLDIVSRLARFARRTETGITDVTPPDSCVVEGRGD